MAGQGERTIAGERYRIDASVAHHGRLVLQKWYPHVGVWCDVSDPGTEEELRAKLAEVADRARGLTDGSPQ